jgi:LPS-assembly protein
VRARQGGNAFSGSALEIDVRTLEGFVVQPSYFFDLTQAGGTATRLELRGPGRAEAIGANYTSCPADGSGDPDWLLSTRSVKLDFEANEGIAEGAVLRFKGFPILALPVLSFPLSSERKSGWLPPTINLDTKSGLETAVPYYWNIAPDLDATFTPRVITRRGVGLDGEFRYLLPQHRGIAAIDYLPQDAVVGRQRFSTAFHHDGTLPGSIDYRALWMRVSDDNYWKDFPRGNPSLTPRLLPSDFALTRRAGDWTTYARAQRWQILQDADPASRIIPPYQRSPQLGVRWTPESWGGWTVDVESEFNRFELPAGLTDPTRSNGDRAHLLAAVSRPWITPGFRFVPRLSLNAAAYRVEDPAGPFGPTGTQGEWTRRLVPTGSLDATWVLEREAQFLGRTTQQTVEPRILYVRTPFREQRRLPNYDAAGRDFNFESLFAENAFVGIDRVSDADQFTLGLTSRIVDAASGAELVRLGAAQRVLLRDQQLTPEGQLLTQRFSDVLIAGSTALLPKWQFDAGAQFSPAVDAAVRTVFGVRHFPGPFRTVNLNYRFTRGLTEQVEVGWQWPLFGPGPLAPRRGLQPPPLDLPGPGASAGAADSRCSATWYGVGRLNYSLRDRRLTDSILGLEYDSGCWIGRVVVERLSTGRSEATTRLLLQLELVGLSRLGSNPLQVLKDNVPGYRLLRERASGDAPGLSPTTAVP